MIRLDDIRTALRTPDPEGTLDGLIRRELGGGRTIADVYRDFTAVLPEVYRLPECAGAALDGLQGALDALSGQCHPDAQYKDAPPPATNGAAMPRGVTTPHP